jgi:hypothetical protein
MLISLALLVGSLRKMLTVLYQSALYSSLFPPGYSDPLSVDSRAAVATRAVSIKLRKWIKSPLREVTQKVKWVN